MLKKTLLAIFMIYFAGCSSEIEFEPVFEVHSDFETIVENFVTEASLRGKNIEIDNLIIRYDDSLENNVCGRCNSINNDPYIQKIILINNGNCWLNDAQKEALIFHELGHCLLGRLHDETKLPNGDPKSMMIPNDLSIYSGCIYALGGDTSCNKAYRRSYYLDELFDETTPTPDWAK